MCQIEEVIIVEGAETDERALEEVWLHLLPLCRNLRSFFLNFEASFCVCVLVKICYEYGDRFLFWFVCGEGGT